MKFNIVYILADDMGYGDISANNENCPFETTNIDSIAKNGIRFTDAHATSSVCTPSRYGLLTGRYNWRSPLKEKVLGGYSTHIIKEGRETIATILKKQGYSTHAIGKWHIGMDFCKTEKFIENPNYAACEGIDYDGEIKNTPLDCGFDSFFGISASLDMPPYVYIKDRNFTNHPSHISEGQGKEFWRKGPTADDFVHEHVLDNFTDKVIEKIDECKEEPFFIYFPMPAPHTPILPAKTFQGKSNTNEYGDFILHCDDVVGRIVTKLKNLGLYENTLIVYTSDNGCSPSADFKELKAKGHNPSYIFRGMKADIYEGGHRIPLLMQCPNQIKKGLVSDSIVCLTDFMRTLTDSFGMSLPDNAGEDSVSLLPILNGNNVEVRDDIIHQSWDGSLSIRKGKWKLEMCPGTGSWIHPRNNTSDIENLPIFQLYDLENDIGETTNVFQENEEVFIQLKSLLIKRIKDGRSTVGEKQLNEGASVWKAVEWLQNFQAYN